MTAAKPQIEHVVVVSCPPSAGYGRRVVEAEHGGGAWNKRTCCRCICCLIGVAAFITGIVLLGVFLDRRFPNEDPVYSVAVAGVAGLDPARGDLSAGGDDRLSPVLNLTVHVDNARNAGAHACVPARSAATVSYGDAFLGRGSVPEFCAGRMRESERAARVWGQDVAVPRFLRDQLAAELAVGDATVDVQMTMPEECSGDYHNVCRDSLLVCKAKIGGGLSPCELTRVRQGAANTP